MKLTIIEFDVRNPQERAFAREILGALTITRAVPPSDLQVSNLDTPEDESFCTVYGTPESVKHAADNASFASGTRVDVSELDSAFEEEFKGKTLADVLPSESPSPELTPVKAAPASVPVNSAPSSDDIMADVLNTLQAPATGAQQVAADVAAQSVPVAPVFQPPVIAAAQPAPAAQPATVTTNQAANITTAPTPVAQPASVVLPAPAAQPTVVAQPDGKAVDWDGVTKVLQENPPQPVPVVDGEKERHAVRMLMVEFMQTIGPEGISYAMEVLVKVAGVKGVDDVPIPKLKEVFDAMKADLDQRKAAKQTEGVVA